MKKKLFERWKFVHFIVKLDVEHQTFMSKTWRFAFLWKMRKLKNRIGPYPNKKLWC